MERLERLVNLVVALLDTPRPLTREQLRRRVGGYSDDDDNFHRNFERDKDLLRQMGIPLVSEPLSPDLPDGTTGYRIPRDLYELPDPGLSENELMALRLAVAAVALDGSEQGTATRALWKLSGAGGRPGTSGEVAGVPADERVAALFGAGKLADVPTDERVAALFGAVSERQVACFEYGGVARRVNPWRLSYRRGRWYLAGFDQGRGSERLFRVDRIAGPVEVEARRAAFERPGGTPPGPPQPWRLGDDEEVSVDLRVDASQASWVATVAGADALVRNEPDGTAYFRLAVTNRAALRGFVLGLLDHAEVLGPPDVRGEVIAWLTSIAGRGS
jgi:predicted DNA-binding transcriptional regulator YafY